MIKFNAFITQEPFSMCPQNLGTHTSAMYIQLHMLQVDHSIEYLEYVIQGSKNSYTSYEIILFWMKYKTNAVRPSDAYMHR